MLRALLIRGGGSVVGRGVAGRCASFGQRQWRPFSQGELANELKDVLSSEIDTETQNMQPDPDLDDAVAKLKASGASISQTNGSGRIVISLPQNVRVTFDCRDVEAEAEEEGEDEGEEAGAVEFDVSVEKDGKRLVFECLASDGVQIDAVSFYQPGVDEEDKDVYDGPTFADLDVDLQSAFYHYLEGYGINCDLCAFINMYATHKENLEYVNWLQEVKKFVE